MNRDYLTIGKLYFARNEKALCKSLFKPRNGQSASGLFKVKANGVLFMLPNGEPFAFLVDNRHEERFFVSCSKREGGKLLYMFSLSDSDQVRLGLAGFPYSEERKEAERVAREAQSIRDAKKTIPA
jgi:hypothetical protein